jgi:hypothetical protein
MVTLQLSQIRVPPGQRIILEDVNWQVFEAILNELGEYRRSRVAYSQGTLEIMAPLPEHERAKIIIGDFVKALLDELDLNWESLGSTTFTLIMIDSQAVKNTCNASIESKGFCFYKATKDSRLVTNIICQFLLLDWLSSSISANLIP